MSFSLIVVACLIFAAVVTVIVIGGMYLLMIAADGDTVSTAREGWIHRRSEKDPDVD